MLAKTVIRLCWYGIIISATYEISLLFWKAAPFFILLIAHLKLFPLLTKNISCFLFASLQGLSLSSFAVG
jgi:hypothetical protein